MGWNINLCNWLDLPKKVKCKNCRRKIETHFDDYDVDVHGEFPATNGKWKLYIYCSNCDTKFYFSFKVEQKKIKLYEITGV